MNTVHNAQTINPDSRPTNHLHATSTADHVPALRRFFGVVTRSRSYRNIAYLLLGLPLGTVWFTVLVTGYSLATSLLVLALLGIPLLLGMWYVTRVCGNVERAITNALLDTELPPAPFASGTRGNLWVRLKAMSAQRERWRELAFLALRFPAGVATFAAAVTALSMPFVVAYAPIAARTKDEPFGDWFGSDRLEEIASSPWAWLLVPLGLLLVFVAAHAMNALARVCGRWAEAWL